MSVKPYPVLVKGYYKLISYDKIRFIVIGGIGFIVNYVVLTIVYHILGAPIIVGQVLGAELALLATFVGNNYWAFSGHHHVSIRKKLIKFHASAVGGLIINSVTVVLLVHYAHLYYGLALIVGSALGLIWNYTLYKKFVFNAHTGIANELDKVPIPKKANSARSHS
jgi:putative flippase GtrA